MNVFLLLTTVLALGGLALGAVVSITMGLRLRAAALAAVAAGVTAMYGAGLVGTSLASHDDVLPVGATKRFCGFYLDCHLGVTVVDAQSRSSVGARRASGSYRVITLRVSSNAVRVTLQPERLRVMLLGANGTRYARDLAAERELAGGRDVALERAIEAGGAYDVTVVFDVPDDVRADWIHVAEGRGPDMIVEGILIGDEDSFLHRKTLLALPTDGPTRDGG